MHASINWSRSNESRLIYTGGTGFSFSKLRAEGSYVFSTSGSSSGPVSFMKVFDTATDVIKQGGKRRGASLATIRVDHPDILSFIRCKDDTHTLNNFNISVSITDDFMDKVVKGLDYNIIDHNGEVVAELNAYKVFKDIVHQAWKNGEPGILFIDTINKENIYGTIEATNPCGEQPLLPYESCNLGSINLANMVKYNERDNSFVLDIAKITYTVDVAIHFLDNVIDINKYPIPEIDKTTKETRKIGLGIMGWADLLTMMKIPYNSNTALSLAEYVMDIINKAARASSDKLGEARGCFPAYESIKDKFHAKYPDRKTPRNLYLTTIAPTGTISMIAGASSGIEPLFAVSYYKQCLDGNKFMEINPYFEAIAKNEGFYSEDLIKQVIKSGSVQHINDIPDNIKAAFITAHDITPEDHVKMQAAFQRHIDNAISKTINFNNTATEQDIANVFIMAWKLGCKGITVYRDGSREEQVLNLNSTTLEHIEEKVETKETPFIADTNAIIKPRPEILHGFTRKIKIGCGSIYVSINHDDSGRIFEVFTTLGKNGGCSSQSEATARAVSLWCRAGMPIEEMIKQIRGIKCKNCIGKDNVKVMSCPDAIARTMELFMENFESQKALPTDIQKRENETNKKATNSLCPECGAPILNESGCITCSRCGWSKCS